MNLRKKPIAEAVGKVAESAADIVESTSSKNQITERQEIDMYSDSKLTKAIRPLITLWAMLMFTYILLGEQHFGFVFEMETRTTVKWILTTSIGFYFVGRTVEKLTTTVNKAKREEKKELKALEKQAKKEG